MPEQRKFENGQFLEKLKRGYSSCYTDRILANQIAREPVSINCLMISIYAKQSNQNLRKRQQISGGICAPLTASKTWLDKFFLINFFGHLTTNCDQI